MRRAVRATTALLGLLTAGVAVSALGWPDPFSELVNFPPHRHFVHDVGAFQLGIGLTLLLATVWTDAVAVALAGYLVGGLAHTVVHALDGHLGGSPAQTWLVGLLAVAAGAALLARLRELGWVVGEVRTALAPAWAPFTRQKTVLLTTYRRDGTPVGTPVSIAVDGDRAYVRSFQRAWKTRRIARDAVVTVAPCTARGAPTGAAIEATARLLPAAERGRAARALRRKYPLLHGVLVPMAHRVGRARTGPTVHFELVARRSPATPPADVVSPVAAHRSP
ncbi:MAG TPA: PPOX class F420-dependent oxidoreductase [Catenuloplanes sp.]|jgi:PPOX class probable F420-dependent enzyme